MTAEPPNPLLAAAIKYAAAGNLIFPLKPNKAPYTKNGMKDATTDIIQIERWWHEYPDAIIGCRIPENVIVLDVDPRHGGDGTWAALEARRGQITTGRIHASGRGDGGRHYWFKRPADIRLSSKRLDDWARANCVGEEQINPKTGKAGWSAGIDILRHEHRYSILPPSPHPDTGKPYTWIEQGEPAEMPKWLVHLITKPDEPAPTEKPSAPYEGDSIADWYTSTATWADILTGWTVVEGDGETDGSKWRHPTASAAWSASIKYGCLFVYSPNTGLEETEPDDPHGYTKFRAYTELHHGGDGTAAAKAAFELRDGPKPDLTAIAADLHTVKTYEPPTGDWQEPIPLASQNETPPFPVGDLPSWMQPHVLAVAAEQQVAVDLPAMLGITALAFVNVKKYRVRVFSEWVEPLNLYTLTALPPSAGKSPVFKRMFKAIEKRETALVEEAESRAQIVAQKRRIIEKRMHKAEQSGDDFEAKVALDELMKTPAVVPPRFIVDDITVEKLVDMLNEQNGRLALLSDEGGLFDAMVGRYSEKVNLDPYLQAWSGGTIRSDRIGRGTVIVQDPQLTIGVTVQPSVIEALAAKPELAGRGLTARFMFSIPEDFVGNRDFLTLRRGDRAAADRYDAHIGAMLVDEPPAEPREMELTDDALTLFMQWRQWLEDQRKPDGDMRPMATWSTKLESSVVRLAALLALADGNEEVRAEEMRRAFNIGDYWIAHARLAHDLWGTSEVVQKAKVIVRWAGDRKLEEFSVRDLYNERRTEFPDAGSTVAPLKLLMERGWLRPLFDGDLVIGRRGVESPKFKTHPKVIHSPVEQSAQSACGQSTPHAAHAAHASKDISRPYSVSVRTPSQIRHPTHEPHEPHDSCDQELPVDSEIDPIDDPMEIFG